MLAPSLVPRMCPVSGTHPCPPVITRHWPARMSLRHIRGTKFPSAPVRFRALSGKAGVQERLQNLDSGFRRNDKQRSNPTLF